MSFNQYTRLIDLADYSPDKIAVNELNINNYISTENLLPNFGSKIEASSLPTISKVTKYRKGDTLVSNIRPYFKKIWYAKETGGASNDVLVFRPKKTIDSLFLYYNLASDKFFDYVMSGAKGTKMPRGDKSHINGFLIPDIPVVEQQTIARILSTLDDKIEVNNKINKTLENMAHEIFKRWFVDFEFPNEDGEPYKSSGGEMVESELGLIPKNSVVKKLKNIAKVQKGLSYKGKFLCEDGVPMMNLGSIKPGGGYRDEKLKYYNGEYNKRHIVEVGDILIANTDMTQDRTILGSPCLVPELNSEAIIFTHHLFALKSLKVSKYFLYFYLMSSSFRERAESFATGTTVLGLASNGIEELNLYIPSASIMINYEKIIEPILKKIETIFYENKKLNDIRESLLPKLMSGEVRVALEES